DRIGQLRLNLQMAAPAPDANLAQLVELRHFVAAMAEEAGRERFMFGGNIAQKKPINGQDLRAISEHRGQQLMAWQSIVAFLLRTDVPPALAAAIGKVDQEYLRRFGELRASVLAAAATGEYPLSGREWVDQSGAAIATIVKLGEEIGAVTRAEVSEASS